VACVRMGCDSGFYYMHAEKLRGCFYNLLGGSGTLGKHELPTAR
jgi:hypothetical protein